MKKFEPKDGLGELIERGGIYYALPGNSIREVLEALSALIPVPETIPSKNLLWAILEREALMSTGIGRGIAVPHPRNPMIEKAEEQFVSLAFLEHPADWHALDNRAVDTVFLIVSASPQFHLQALSEITFFCHEEIFLKLLKERAPRDELLQFIKNTEQEWKKMPGF